MPAIDLSKLPPPEVVKKDDSATVFTNIWGAVTKEVPGLQSVLPSDPAVKLARIEAARETNLQGKINDAARAVMLATAKGADLDQLAALLNVQRKVIDPGDAKATPPRPKVMESDDAFRDRIQKRWDTISTAGPAGGYEWHALQAHGKVRAIKVVSPAPSQVSVIVLSHSDNGVPNAEILKAVHKALNAESVIPIGDRVTVLPAKIQYLDVKAKLNIGSGPDASTVKADAIARVRKYMTPANPLGREVTISGLHEALHRPGVDRVDITSPTDNISVAFDTAVILRKLEVTT
ncbi:MAG: baseplate J/gp47 family protein [Pseudomonadota bacterium]